jgi:hypothetical protein
MVMNSMIANALDFRKLLIECCSGKTNLIDYIILAGTTRTFSGLVYALAIRVFARRKD